MQRAPLQKGCRAWLAVLGLAALVCPVRADLGIWDHFADQLADLLAPRTFCTNPFAAIVPRGDAPTPVVPVHAATPAPPMDAIELPVAIPTGRWLRETKPLWENFSILGGLDGAKGPEDLGISENFGARFTVQTAFPLIDRWGVGLQIGTGLNYHETMTRFLHALTGVHDRTQSFTTLGLFQRSQAGWNWGVAYDFLYESYYVDMNLGQWRGQVGYWYDADNEIGLWGTLRSHGEQLIVNNTQTLTLEPINQLNLYWRHVWPSDAVTRMWIGLAEEHGRFVLFGPSAPSVHHPIVFGAEVFIPLSANVAIFGEANFITPNDTGTVTAMVGLIYYPAGTVGGVFRNRYAPLLPVANNPTFGVNLRP
jgi:hypothetical protein